MSTPETSAEPILLPTASGTATLHAVGGLLRRRRLLAAISLLVLVAATAVGLLVPPVLGHIVDLVTEHHGPASITGPALLLFAVAAGQAVFTAAGDVLVARLGESLLARLRERVVDRALDLPLGQVERAGSGDLVSRVSGDVAVVAAAVRSVLPALAGAGLTVVLTLVGLAALDWRFALAGLLAAPIQLYTLRWYLRRSTPVFAAQRVAEGARAQQLLDSVDGADTVRRFGLSRRHLGEVRRRSGDAVEYVLAASRLATRFYGRLNVAECVGLGAILAVGFWLVRDGAATVGAAAAAALYFHRLFDPINTLLGLFGTAQEAAAGLARLVGVLQIEPETGPPSQPAAPQPATPRDASLTLDAVSFGYQAGVPVLRDVRLAIGPGEHVALVGASGAGKTTLAKLAAGIHPPARGTIRLGGVAIERIGPAELARTVALVTQEVHVFAGALTDDLRLARPTASEDELTDALRTVGALPWVCALPDGLRTVVGDGGYRLTAGQAQQLALARVLLADPPIVVLDEASADAGSAGACELDAAAGQLMRGRTALVVAHRLSQAAQCDRVVVLDGGEVVEAGSHDELVAAGGRYFALWSAWSGARAGAGAPGFCTP